MGCVAGEWLSGLFHFWDWHQLVLTLTRGCQGGWGLTGGSGRAWDVYGGQSMGERVSRDSDTGGVGADLLGSM